jgi:hypothetical protein
MSGEHNRLQQNSIYRSLDILQLTFRAVYVPGLTGWILLKRARPWCCVKWTVKGICSCRNIMQPFDAYSEFVSEGVRA